LWSVACPLAHHVNRVAENRRKLRPELLGYL
jgi:hypothetical protein